MPRNTSVLAQALEATNATLGLDGTQVRNDNVVGAVFQARFKPLMEILLKLAKGASDPAFS